MVVQSEQHYEHGTLAEALWEPKQVKAVGTALVRIADAWSLTSSEATSLYGLTLADWNQMKAGTFNYED